MGTAVLSEFQHHEVHHDVVRLDPGLGGRPVPVIGSVGEEGANVDGIVRRSGAEVAGYPLLGAGDGVFSIGHAWQAAALQ